jgi:hypothetical protein
MTPLNHFDIRLTPQELDYIAGVLMDRPHREVAVLLSNIKNQIDYQQKAASEPVMGLAGDVPQHLHAVQPQRPLSNGHDAPTAA